MKNFLITTLLLAIIVAFIFVLLSLMSDAHQKSCAKLGAHSIETGQGRYICTDPQGRIVGP